MITARIIATYKCDFCGNETQKEFRILPDVDDIPILKYHLPDGWGMIENKIVCQNHGYGFVIDGNYVSFHHPEGD